MLASHAHHQSPTPLSYSSRHQAYPFADLSQLPYNATNTPLTPDASPKRARAAFELGDASLYPAALVSDPDQFPTASARAPQTSMPAKPAVGSSLAQMSTLADSLGIEASWQSFRSSGNHAMRAATGSSHKSHQRVPSASSVGSAGPPSPYDSIVSHPFIVNPDASHLQPSTDTAYYDDLSSSEHSGSLSMSKSPPSSARPSRGSFLAPAFQNYNPQRQDESTLEAKMAMLQALKEHHGPAEDHSPVPGFSTPGRASSGVGHPSPVTPKASFGEDNKHAPHSINQRESPPIHVFDDDECSLLGVSDLPIAIPKLDRSISTVYQDELFDSTAFALSLSDEPAQTPIRGQNQQLLSPYPDVFSERMQAANQEHLHSQAHAATSSVPRERSPFRQGSPYGPSANSFGAGSAAHLRERQKAEADATALRRAQSQQVEATPKTISPKDALLDFHASEEEMKMPLFPSVETTMHYSPTGHAVDVDDDALTEHSYPSMATSRRPSSSGFSTGSVGAPASASSAAFTFAPPSVPRGIQLPQQYPFIPQSRRPSRLAPSDGLLDHTPDFPAHLTSMESSASEAAPDSSAEAVRPERTSADSGTYTCTYHGCSLRFETPAKLQKHKREGHRPSTPGQDVAAQLRNSQAGPHKCERINPSTGKPCNAIFSRPYDLTRHEDTIHNARKQKVRCHLCTEEKSFSRNDALTRHMRVVHPEVEFGARSRRKHQL
ncbi:MAG: hypothetical protein M1838_002500 [Thelocarpon superellum]|nr:MAG: hypothetical protein M1838_002500 [Thelocarpon superellum]